MLVPSLALFSHTGKHHHLFKAMIGGTGIDLVAETIEEALTAHADARLEQLVAERGQPSASPRVVATCVVGALLALLTWWLDNDMPFPPEEAAHLSGRPEPCACVGFAGSAKYRSS
jgi:hypothetical protein